MLYPRTRDAGALGERVCRGTPFPGRLLPRQDKATSASAPESSCWAVAGTTPDGARRLGEGGKARSGHSIPPKGGRGHRPLEPPMADQRVCRGTLAAASNGFWGRLRRQPQPLLTSLPKWGCVRHVNPTRPQG